MAEAGDRPSQVEVVFATPDLQVVIEVDLVAGMTIDDAIRQSGIQASFPDDNLDELPTGIWGSKKDRATLVTAGDRVEIYRPLVLTPQEARRRRALQQKEKD